LRLAGALYLFWYLRGHAAEGYAWLEDLLARVPADEVPVARRAKALNGAGTLAHYLGDYGYARARYEQSLTLRREMGDVQGVAASLNNLGLLTSEQGANDQAAALYEESLALARALDDPEGISITLNNLGDVARAEGNHARAAEAYRESLALAEARGDMAVMAEALTNLGDLARERGDVQQAEKRYTRSLVLLRGVDEGRLIALNLEGLAGVAGTQGHMACAARLFGAAAALREAIGAPVSPTDRARYERDVLIVRTALGNEALAREWAEGRALPLEQAIAYALEGDVHT
jgi:tetratricopeptide (TPR) repeat protein